MIVSIDGRAVERFEDVQQAVRLNPGVPMAMVVRRDGQLVDAARHAEPASRRTTGSAATRSASSAFAAAAPSTSRATRPPRWSGAVGETWNLSATTLQAMWQIIIGTRGTDELGGPLRIAQLSGEVAQGGIVPLLWFMAVLSINLGLINLFPVPVLDGGHLLFYAAEAIRGKPLGQRAQEYGFRIGLALVLTLMVFATWNDLVHTGIVDLVKRFVT